LIERLVESRNRAQKPCHAEPPVFETVDSLGLNRLNVRLPSCPKVSDALPENGDGKYVQGLAAARGCDDFDDFDVVVDADEAGA
jgi:hypothetical protein